MDTADLTAAVEARDFSIATVAYYHPDRVIDLHTFLVMSPRSGIALEAALAHCRRTLGEPDRIHVYPRNYVRRARTLAAQGEVIWP